ncbi:MAG: hypothetical protein IIA67_12355 [Planctomycetes bacterium]|nr:hypothetical protein [Planctomycetota bacterium]
MAKRVANTFVLVEDVAQQSLVLAYLKRAWGKNYSIRNIRLADLPGARGADEPITVLVPKRHVETWIQALLGNDVDESADYKRPKPTPQDFKNAAETLYDWTRPNARLGENCPPSLSDAVSEWQRIPP